MYTSDINNKSNSNALKTATIYMMVSAFCIVFNKIYSYYGHGITSPAMSHMFLYPLLGGALPFLIIRFFIPHGIKFRSYRLFYNCYNSGISLAIVGSLLKGVFDIAGTASKFVIFYFITGWALMFLGQIGYLIELYLLKKIKK